MLTKTKLTLCALVLAAFLKPAPLQAQAKNEEPKPAKLSFDATAWLKTQYANMRGWAPWQAPVTQVEATLRYGKDKTGISLYYWENRGYQFRFGQLTEWDLCLIADHSFSQRLSATAGFDHYYIPKLVRRPQGTPGMKYNLLEWFINGNYSLYQPKKGILKDVSLTLTYYDDFSKDCGGKILEAGIKETIQFAKITISAKHVAIGNSHYFTNYDKFTGVRTDVEASVPISNGFLFKVMGRLYITLVNDTVNGLANNHSAIGAGIQYKR